MTRHSQPRASLFSAAPTALMWKTPLLPMVERKVLPLPVLPGCLVFARKRTHKQKGKNRTHSDLHRESTGVCPSAI